MTNATTTKTALAKKLGIARSSLYYQPKKPPKDEVLKAQIMAVMTEHKAYGHRRIAMELQWNKKQVRRIMKKFFLKPSIRRGIRPFKADDLGRGEVLATNILKTLSPLQPNIVWAGDFTYLWLHDRFWYLATVIDVYTREIVGWHVANHHTTNLIMQAFQDAVRRQGAGSKFFHSDQGSEYVSGAYESLLVSHGTTPSFSRKSSPWQNGYQESFYSQFKLELGTINHLAHAGYLIELVAQHITYYNTKRIHTRLKMPPAAFRQQYEKNHTNKKTATKAVSTSLIYQLINPSKTRNTV